MKAEIYPCILATNYPEYATRLEMIEASPAKWAQVDIMDGIFVEHKTILPSEIVDATTRLNLEAHLMVMQPDQYYEDLSKAGFSRILIHREIFSNLNDCSDYLTQAREYFPEIGLVINPDTVVEDYSKLPISSIQVMGVHPGASGQAMLESTYDTIEKVKAQNLGITIAVDGGVNESNIIALKNAGVSRFIMASAVFENHTVEKNFNHFISLISPGGV